MDSLPLVASLTSWLLLYYPNLLWSFAVLVLHFVIINWTLPKIQKGIKSSRLNEESAKRAFGIARLVLGTLTLAALCIVWGFDFSGLLLISTSLITITGVALFANWSLLSNLTAYFVLLFQPTYSRGNFIRIFEADNFVEGQIVEVNLFNIKLLTDEDETILYPNNLLLTRITMLNPKTKLKGFGKIAPLAGSAPDNHSPEKKTK
ncbi:mechanosensitive ion channel family protein [Glaciecola sp. MH2013]|uniref:mechanosensitive ion channel family protein n=1 Tax=Glaciecola sp. MH2013 TaxID=2785524 RepID=UPI0018A0B301|nr:mechanosensitive ion channel family protein [Glaciecola sp. MH2013]MBF7073512.1 mechanosensitive ion channel family protein [Glaciecola sp. MH2013]